MKLTNMKTKKSTTRVIAFGFATIILIGALLLSMPFSVQEGSPNFIEALFTATSATCVTGLVVVDTYQHWTIFGKCVIFCLIQVGGLGFMTIGVYVAVAFKKKIGLQQRETLHESVNTLEIAGVVRLTKYIIQGTILIELIGALLLSFRFIPQKGFWRGLAFGVFHSVSAFCNAGFDLMGDQEKYSSLIAYEGDVLVNVVIMALIMIGGIGFIVWDDIARNKLHFNKYLLHTKIALITTVALTVGGTILFLIVENDYTLAGMSWTEKLCGAAFSAVTPRTAGFNTVDTGALSNAGKLLTIFLMFVGGSPGSTAGGVKTTTLIVILFYAVAMVRNRQDINVCKRRLPEETVKKANAVVVINMSSALIAGFLIMIMQNFSFTQVLFETFSAIGTVGMSEGITRDLNTASRIIIIILMYAGRLGSLSFALLFGQSKKTDLVRSPEEKIVVGEKKGPGGKT